ncbi:MAG: oxidoreductase, partial [Clostridiales bacterium]|nr:oxidoreductase [Clostridiales bacterium]
AQTKKTGEACKGNYPHVVFSVGEGSNANAFELSLALLRYGFSVAEIFSSIGEGDFLYLDKIAKISPETRVYSNLEPTMLYYDCTQIETDITIGKDAAYYHADAVHVEWSDDIQPFGYAGVRHFFEACDQALSGNEREEDVLALL